MPVGASWLASLAASVAVTALVYLLRDRRAPAPSSEPACAACGYIVLGLPSSVCPECGSDLRAVGLRFGRRQRQREDFAAVLALWFAVATLLVLTTRWLAAEGAFWRYEALFAGGVKLPEDASATRDWRLGVRGTFSRWALKPSWRTFDANLQFLVDSAEQHALHIDAANGRWSHDGGAISDLASSSSRKALVEDWLRSCGVAPTDEEVTMIVTDITELISAMRRTGRCFHLDVKGVSLSGGGNGLNPSRVGLARAVLLASLFWPAGLILLIARCRRQMRLRRDENLRDAGLA